MYIWILGLPIVSHTINNILGLNKKKILSTNKNIQGQVGNSSQKVFNYQYIYQI